MQIIINLLDTLALVQDLAAILLVQSERLNLSIAVLQVLRKHL